MDFDTVAGLWADLDAIDRHTAAGPASTNEHMPPNNALPTLEERLDLGSWLACEAP